MRRHSAPERKDALSESPEAPRRFSLHLDKSEFWSGDLGLTLITITLLVFIFVILPMEEAGLPGRIALDIVLLLLMVAGALKIEERRVTTIFAISVALVAAIVLWIALLHPTPPIRRASSVLSVVALLTYVWIVLLVMFRRGRVTWTRLQGGVAAYLLLGLAWSAAYQLVEELHEGSFHFLTPPKDLSQLSAKMAYFSFTTLTTVGFGDITPLAPFARSLAIAEALVGQLFPAILIGALVAMAMSSQSKS
jgi:Ion channel